MKLLASETFTEQLTLRHQMLSKIQANEQTSDKLIWSDNRLSILRNDREQVVWFTKPCISNDRLEASKGRQTTKMTHELPNAVRRISNWD